MDSGYLLRLAEIFAAHRGLSLATVSNYVCRHARLFDRLKAGCSCTLRTYLHAIQWFSDHWPSNLEWPEEIAKRPDPTSDSPAAQATAEAAAQAPPPTPHYGPDTPPAEVLAAACAAWERMLDLTGGDHPDLEAASRAEGEALAIAMTLGPNGTIASPDALCKVIGVSRKVFSDVVKRYADGRPRQHKQPRRRKKEGFLGVPIPTDTEKMFTALVASGDVRFASRRRRAAA